LQRLLLRSKSAFPGRNLPEISAGLNACGKYSRSDMHLIAGLKAEFTFRALNMGKVQWNNAKHVQL